MKKTIIIIMLMALVPFVNADVLQTKDGKLYHGQLRDVENCSVKFKIKRSNYNIPATDIDFILFDDTTTAIYQKFVDVSQNKDACMKAMYDANYYHGKAFKHWTLGFLFGPLTILGELISNPKPKQGKETAYSSDNRDLFTDPVYLNCYKSQAKSNNLYFAMAGWLTSTLLLLQLK